MILDGSGKRHGLDTSGFPVQALPLQVPESPERSERLEVFADSRRLTRGEGSGKP